MFKLFDEGSGPKIVFAKGRARKLIKTKTHLYITSFTKIPIAAAVVFKL